MGVYVDGVWHEELADPNPEGGSNLTSAQAFGGSTSGGGGGGGGGTTSSGYYQTVNGLQTLQTMEQQLRAVGWQGGEDVATAYARTTGGGVTPSGGGTATTAGGGGVGQASGSDVDALRAFYSQTAGFSREELAEKVRQFNEQLALTERQWEREGKPRLQIDQDIQALRRYEVEKTLGLRERELGLEEEIRRGQLGLDRGRLGLDYLTQAAQLGGPADYFQSVDFLRGARQRGDLPTFLQSLRENTQLPGFSGAGLTPPEAQTMAGLSNKLTGAGPLGTYDSDSALRAIGSIFQRGATGLTPGSLERLDQNELDLLRSGGRKLGWDPDAWLRAYGRAGIGQTAGI